ncbi:MAG: DUF4124 domain-containing protein [Nitrospirae bacterium]|nr:DUF4124 domain-containing protein [Nitrospirota bacterium]
MSGYIFQFSIFNFQFSIYNSPELWRTGREAVIDPFSGRRSIPALSVAFSLLFVALHLFPASSPAAEGPVYQYHDDEGNVHFTDDPTKIPFPEKPPSEDGDRADRKAYLRSLRAWLHNTGATGEDVLLALIADHVLRQVRTDESVPVKTAFLRSIGSLRNDVRTHLGVPGALADPGLDQWIDRASRPEGLDPGEVDLLRSVPTAGIARSYEIALASWTRRGRFAEDWRQWRARHFSYEAGTPTTGEDPNTVRLRVLGRLLQAHEAARALWGIRDHSRPFPVKPPRMPATQEAPLLAEVRPLLRELVRLAAEEKVPAAANAARQASLAGPSLHIEQFFGGRVVGPTEWASKLASALRANDYGRFSAILTNPPPVKNKSSETPQEEPPKRRRKKP